MTTVYLVDDGSGVFRPGRIAHQEHDGKTTTVHIVLDPVEDVACTGVTARWCPVCGDCNCCPAWDGPTCPLHSSSSPHPR